MLHIVVWSTFEMSEGFVYIGDVPTHIFTRGNWIEESFNKKEMVLCITGNPGLPGYYTQFAKCVYDTLGREIPVWIIGVKILFF